MSTTTAKRPARTTRVPNAFAGSGAVHQHGGSLPIHSCNTCGSEVVWATSNRTGGRYLANVRHGYMDQRYYIGASLHKCQPVLDARAADIAHCEQLERNRAAGTTILAARRDLDAGRITEDQFLAILDGLEI